jgi:hypothetical protein
MRWGKQHRYCPNCGRHRYDDKISVSHVKSMCCGPACRAEWEMKYARMVLHQDADPNAPLAHALDPNSENPENPEKEKV